MQEYLDIVNSKQKRVKTSFDFSTKFHEFYDEVYGQNSRIIRPPFQKILRQKFDPMA